MIGVSDRKYFGYSDLPAEQAKYLDQKIARPRSEGRLGKEPVTLKNIRLTGDLMPTLDAANISY